MPRDPAEKLAYDRWYKQTNREMLRAKARARYAADPEKERVRRRAYHAANLEKETRSNLINNWGRNNVNPWPYASRAELHDLRYAVATHCEYCTRAFASVVSPINPRCMEHDHRPPFLFRAISCRCCNAHRRYWDARILAVHAELVTHH